MKKFPIKPGNHILISVFDKDGNIVVEASSKSFGSFDDAKSTIISMLSHVKINDSGLKVRYWNTSQSVIHTELIIF
jgi:hypothetical protein